MADGFWWIALYVAGAVVTANLVWWKDRHDHWLAEQAAMFADLPKPDVSQITATRIDASQITAGRVDSTLALAQSPERL